MDDGKEKMNALEEEFTASKSPAPFDQHSSEDEDVVVHRMATAENNAGGDHTAVELPARTVPSYDADAKAQRGAPPDEFYTVKLSKPFGITIAGGHKGSFVCAVNGNAADWNIKCTENAFDAGRMVRLGDVITALIHKNGKKTVLKDRNHATIVRTVANADFMTTVEFRRMRERERLVYEHWMTRNASRLSVLNDNPGPT
jgi:hypothetical protein